MQKTLGKYAFFYLNQIMTVPERSELYTDFEREGNMVDCTYIKFDKFFKSQNKLNLFKMYYIDGNNNLKEFKTQILAGSYHRPEESIRKAPKTFTPVFGEGIELYKGTADSVTEVAINYCNTAFMAIATDKGSREIDIRNSLRLRKRSPDGLKLLDEEMEDWDKGLHRFEQSQQETTQPAFVSACIGKLFGKTKQVTGEFTSFDSAEVIEWSQKNYKEYYMDMIAEPRLHTEPSFSVVAHPHLSLYITGSSKGRLQFWKFDGQDDQALDEYATSANNTSDSHNINSIKLNMYGDKMAVKDVEGSVYIFSIGQRRSVPGVSLKRGALMETAAFDFLNQGTVLCMSSLKPKPRLIICDTLMSPKKCVVMEQEVGGNVILSIKENKQIVLFNSREEGMSLFDMRAGKFWSTFVSLSC
jgi:WD40 repeat protein